MISAALSGSKQLGIVAARQQWCAGAGRGFAAATGKKVAVVLSGCGVADGSEVQESVFVLSRLSRAGATTSCFAPDKPQMHVVDHTKFAPEESTAERNVLKESARIARGSVQALSELRASDFDAVIFPGGFGAAKNLSDFATKGAELEVEPDVERVIKEFHTAKKAMGFCCIAPVLAAKVLGKSAAVELTVGSDKEGESWPYAGAAGAIDALGAKHVVKELSESHVDSGNKVVTSAAWMCGTAQVHEIEDSVAAMVEDTLKLV
eukprot:TRINITY_DN14891_c0_g1_i1.p3 TRINITY_DN14891_c0_g1~~TRINITY_DN14891_c0_g1_i1.p3  ORF type:complete len:263 (-),score=76.73 TRINITY_DN14891_c0_g1_i1:1960-2748(-)